jgi:oxygen-dependent protoporphyrinogen oxidase
MWNQKRGSNTNDKKASGARYSQFVAPRHGMTALINAMAERLPPTALRLDSPVHGLSRLYSGQWRVNVGGSNREELTVDGVVLALPSRHAARLMREVDAELASNLSSIEYGSCAVASFGFRRDQIEHPLDGFGVVIPIVERRKILSATFSSTKFPGRAPKGHVLVRTYIGGACQPELLEQNDDELLAMAYQELVEILGIHGQPVLSHINRQRNAMPQYHVDHLSLAERITRRVDALDGLVLAGNSLHGVGVPQCIHSAEVAVETLFANVFSRNVAIPSSTIS